MASPDDHALTCKVPRFIAWDSEGETRADGSHHLTLFGTSDDYLTGDMTTAEVLDVLLDADPSAVHVIFSGTYDVNMWLGDLTEDQLDDLIGEGHQVVYGDYVISYVPGKFLRLTDGVRNMVLWDVFSFFGVSFVQAVREYLPDHDPDELARLEAMKAKRSEFVDTPAADILAYWRRELDLTVELCTALGEYLERAGYLPRTWHGPGAVASAVFRKHRSRGYMRARPRSWDWTDEVACHAYFGGRFQQFRVGRANTPVHQYDIRSAYPAAITRLPDLHPSSGEWVEDERVHLAPEPGRVDGFGMYLVDYDGTALGRGVPHPLPWRHPSGLVVWPERARAWVHGPELEAMLQTVPDLVDVVSSWEWVPNDGAREAPMSFVGDMYATRAAWKRGGNPAQLALKVGMNSLYGKTVQQVGARRNSAGLWTLPRWHDLTWGGYVTSWCRGKLWEAMHAAGDDLVAVETDAVFTTRELPTLPVSDRLGWWDHTTYDDVAYLQSGVYFTRQGRRWAPKTRGFDRGSLTMDHVRPYLQSVRTPDDFTERKAPEATVTRFVTMTARRPAVWRRWETSTRSVSVDLRGGKSAHDGDCRGCDGGWSLWDGMHDLSALDIGDLAASVVSSPYPVAWRGER